MANQEQLELLKQGTQGWNRWRQDNPDININLSTADLSKASLKGVDLRGADLWEANLQGADLWEANLKGADLTRANLLGADLMETNLTGAASLLGADLRKVNLTKAALNEARLTEVNLTEAELMGVDFTRADLTSADLTHSQIGHTLFGDNNLSNTVGLETIHHAGPSIIGINTIARSKGKIPITFLRGCGLSDLDIEYSKLAAPGLGPDQVTQIVYEIHRLYCGQPIQFYSCFISYSNRDQEFAQRLHNDLQNNGVRCWFAPEDMKAGKKIYQQINVAIQAYDRLLLILSESSMASEWVRTEIANARQKELRENRQVLFPIGLVDFQKIKEWNCFDGDIGKDSAREIREYFIPDFSNWRNEQAYKASFERLLRDLKAQ